MSSLNIFYIYIYIYIYYVFDIAASFVNHLSFYHATVPISFFSSLI